MYNQVDFQFRVHFQRRHRVRVGKYISSSKFKFKFDQLNVNHHNKSKSKFNQISSSRSRLDSTCPILISIRCQFRMPNKQQDESHKLSAALPKCNIHNLDATIPSMPVLRPKVALFPWWPHQGVHGQCVVSKQDRCQFYIALKPDFLDDCLSKV